MSEETGAPEPLQLPTPDAGLTLPVAAVPPPVQGKPLPPKDQAPGVCPPAAVVGADLLQHVRTEIDLAGATYLQMQGRLAVAIAESLAEARGSVQAVMVAVAKHVQAELSVAKAAVDAVALAVAQGVACALGSEAECLALVAGPAGLLGQEPVQAPELPPAMPTPREPAPEPPPEPAVAPVAVQEPECPAPDEAAEPNVCVIDLHEEIPWADALGIEGAMVAVAAGGVWPNFGSLNACKMLPGEFQGLKFSDPKYASRLIGFRDDKGDDCIPGWYLITFGKSLAIKIDPKANVQLSGKYLVTAPKNPEGVLAGARNDLFFGLAATLRDGLDTVYGFVQSYLSSENCKAEAIALPVILRFFLGFLEKWIGDGLPDVRRTLGYWINSQCPTEIPSHAESTQALLAGTINKETWDCWVKANNQHLGPAEQIYLASRSRPNDAEVLTLFLRKKLTKAQAYERLEKLGYVYPNEIADKFNLTEAYPGVSDVIRFMVRDVDDPGEIETLQLDAEFKDKYRSKTQEYGEAQGLTEDLARRYWRAHWDTPSNTQAYEGLHRLRPDRVRDLWGAVIGKNPENFDPQEMTEADSLAVHPDDVYRLLGFNDMVTPWRNRLVALSYRPLTRVDVRRAFFTGQLSRNDVYQDYLDLGYNTINAERLTVFTERERVKSLLNTKIVRKYIDLSMPEAKVRARLRKHGYPDDVIGDVLEQANEYVDAESARICIRGERKRFFSGVYTDAQATTKIAALGFELKDAERILRRWKCEIKSSPKEVSTEKLCRFLELGLIDTIEFEDRLINLGYTLQESTRLIIDCQTRISEKRVGDANRIAKQLANESEKAGRTRMKAIQDAVAAASRKQKGIEDLTADLRRREKALLKATAKLGKRLKIDADQAAERIREQVARLIRERRAPPDQAVEAVLFAAANGPIGVEQDWPELVDSIYESLLAGAPELKNGGPKPSETTGAHGT